MFKLLNVMTAPLNEVAEDKQGIKGAQVLPFDFDNMQLCKTKSIHRFKTFLLQKYDWGGLAMLLPL